MNLFVASAAAICGLTLVIASDIKVDQIKVGEKKSVKLDNKSDLKEIKSQNLEETKSEEDGRDYLESRKKTEELDDKYNQVFKNDKDISEEEIEVKPKYEDEDSSVIKDTEEAKHMHKLENEITESDDRHYSQPKESISKEVTENSDEDIGDDAKLSQKETEYEETYVSMEEETESKWEEDGVVMVEDEISNEDIEISTVESDISESDGEIEVSTVESDISESDGEIEVTTVESDILESDDESSELIGTLHESGLPGSGSGEPQSSGDIKIQPWKDTLFGSGSEDLSGDDTDSGSGLNSDIDAYISSGEKTIMWDGRDGSGMGSGFKNEKWLGDLFDSGENPKFRPILSDASGSGSGDEADKISKDITVNGMSDRQKAIGKDDDTEEDNGDSIGKDHKDAYDNGSVEEDLDDLAVMIHNVLGYHYKQVRW